MLPSPVNNVFKQKSPTLALKAQCPACFGCVCASRLLTVMTASSPQDAIKSRETG